MNFYRKTVWFFALLISFNAVALDQLELMVRTSYPKDTKVVGDAVSYLLEPFGYTLIVNSRYTPTAASIANKPLTPLAKEIRTMPVYDAIQVLIGPENTIIVDHPNKLISLEEGTEYEN